MNLFRFVFGSPLLMCPEGDPPATGGDPKPDLAKEVEALKAQNAELVKKFEALQKTDPEADPDLIEKAKREREEKDKNKSTEKALESALRFTIASKDFVKQNAALLPKDLEQVFAMADKENYESPVQKAQALKSWLIQSFFKVQDNLDLLTPAMKTVVEDYFKLTNVGKNEKSQQIYETVFEPAFEMLKRIKKAEALQKGNDNSSQDVLIEKRIGRANKHFLGEK